MIFNIIIKFQRLLGIIATKLFVRFNAGKVVFKGKSHVVGMPLIHACQGSKIEIGKNVTLLSSNLYYHAQMFRGVKLLADRPGAVISIGDNTRVNGACIHAWDSIKIGKNCLIAANVQIVDANGHELCMDKPELRLTEADKPKPVVIGDNVWVGLNSIILPGAVIGDGCVVAAGSVVTGQFEAGKIIGGVPAKVIK